MKFLHRKKKKNKLLIVTQWIFVSSHYYINAPYCMFRHKLFLMVMTHFLPFHVHEILLNRVFSVFLYSLSFSSQKMMQEGKNYKFCKSD